ncbi:MAG: hypothetical protein HKN25_14905, partial [Pyrinomonadaceae bacterium]|nr:hypothetical protein [Pyrinomonadaceae bacterium]
DRANEKSDFANEGRITRRKAADQRELDHIRKHGVSGLKTDHGTGAEESVTPRDPLETAVYALNSKLPRDYISSWRLEELQQIDKGPLEYHAKVVKLLETVIVALEDEREIQEMELRDPNNTRVTAFSVGRGPEIRNRIENIKFEILMFKGYLFKLTH